MMTDLNAGQMVMPYLYRGKPDLIILNDRIMAERIAAGRPVSSEPRQRGQAPGHGTQARAIWDRRRGNKPCASCLQAEALAHKMQTERRGGRPVRVENGTAGQPGHSYIGGRRGWSRTGQTAR